MDVMSPNRKELLRRFERLSEKEKQDLINSICKENRGAEEANEAFETILSLLKEKGNPIAALTKPQHEDEDLEEEEEEDEESEEETECKDDV